MRLSQLLASAAVVAALYVLILEREALMAFATGGEVAEEQEPEPDTPEPEARSVSVVARDFPRRPVEQVVLMRGRTEANRQVSLRAETGGRVSGEPLRRGAEVAAGDVLCRIETGTRAARLEEAEARLAEAQQELRAAEGLSQGGFAAETRLIGARAAQSSAQAAVAAAELEIDRLSIRAPFDGRLETDTAELGELLQPGEPCATLIQLDPMRITGFVPEARIDRIARGARAGARLADGRTVTGAVSFVARSADPETRTFRVEITVDNPDGALRDGQSADALIEGAAAEGHLIPGSALTLDDDGRVGVRLVDADTRAAFAPVEIMRDTAEGVWVSGLGERARVIVVGHEYVSEGTRLDVTLREDGTQAEHTDPILDFDAVEDRLDALPEPETEPGTEPGPGEPEQ